MASDRDELARLHLQVEVPQGVGLDHIGAEDLADVVHLDHVWLQFSS